MKEVCTVVCVHHYTGDALFFQDSYLSESLIYVDHQQLDPNSNTHVCVKIAGFQWAVTVYGDGHDAAFFHCYLAIKRIGIEHDQKNLTTSTCLYICFFC